MSKRAYVWTHPSETNTYRVQCTLPTGERYEVWFDVHSTIEAGTLYRLLPDPLDGPPVYQFVAIVHGLTGAEAAIRTEGNA